MKKGFNEGIDISISEKIPMRTPSFVLMAGKISEVRGLRGF